MGKVLKDFEGRSTSTQVVPILAYLKESRMKRQMMMITYTPPATPPATRDLQMVRIALLVGALTS